MTPRAHDFGASGVLDFWRSRRQDAKTSIRIDFLASLFHDGLSSRFIHSVLVQFCSRCQLRERMVRLFRLAGEQAGTGRDIRPVFGGQKHYMFCPRQAVFSVTRNRFRNRKQLARKGRENSSEVVVFYRAPRVPTRISILQNVFTHSARHSLRQDSGTDLNGYKNGDDFAKSSLSNGVISSTF